jgi:molecular chaperone GrpE
MSKHKKDKHEDEQNKIIESEENIEETAKENEDKDEKLIDKSEEKIAELEAQVKEWHDKFLRKAGAVKEGIKLVYEKLLKVLDEQGVKKMQVKGEPFNVDYHDALMQRKDDSVPPHTVLEEIEKGYLYRDKVIRHAKVIVSEETSTDDSQISDDNSSDSTLENEN